jgi:hypothetical protein
MSIPYGLPKLFNVLLDFSKPDFRILKFEFKNLRYLLEIIYLDFENVK